MKGISSILSGGTNRRSQVCEKSATTRPFQGRPPIWPVLTFLLVSSFAIRYWNLDLVVQAWFYSEEEGRWLLGSSALVNWLYEYGNLPTLIVGIGCSVVWIGSFAMSPWRRARSLAGFLSIALVVGPGFLVNIIFKDNFGRPRPKQVLQFGGNRPFYPLGKPTFKPREKSFPSGHASMGFFWFVPGIYFWSRWRSLAWVLIGGALIHGGLMGFGRMSQGAHWLSDVLWSGGFVYVSAWILHSVMRPRPESPAAGQNCEPDAVRA